MTSLPHLFQNVGVKTEKFEALSLEELYALADRTGLDLPPGLERPFVIEEVLAVLEEDSEDRRASQGEALHIDEKKYSGLRMDDIEVDSGTDGSLPSRYNETMIHAVVRDPSWAFAYWDVSDAELSVLRGEDLATGLFLRVVETGGANSEIHHEYFDIPVSDEDLQWYINLPRPGVRFRIDLCARRSPQSVKIRILARSNEVESPRQTLSPPPQGLEPPVYELLALSGADDIVADEEGEGNPLRILQSGPAKSADRAD